MSDIYHVYSYPAGNPAVEVQRGTFQIAEGDGDELVTTVLWDDQALYTGMTFASPIRKFDGESFTLLGDAGGPDLVYTATDTMP